MMIHMSMTILLFLFAQVLDLQVGHAASTVTASGTLFGMRYCEILYGICTTLHAQDGSCKTTETAMASSHGLHDCLEFTNLTTMDVNNAWGPDVGYFDVVGLNGVRFFTIDAMQVSGSAIISNVETFNRMRGMQQNFAKQIGVYKEKFADSGMRQTMNQAVGEIMPPPGGRGPNATPVNLFGVDDQLGIALAADAIYSAWASKSSSKNAVGTHCKIFSAEGREVFLLKVPASDIDIANGDVAPTISGGGGIFHYYGLQSVFDTTKITSTDHNQNPQSPASFNGFSQLPPIKNLHTDYSKLPANYEMRKIAALPKGKTLSMCNDENGDIFVRMDEFHNSWMLFVEGLPEWAMQAAGYQQSSEEHGNMYKGGGGGGGQNTAAVYSGGGDTTNTGGEGTGGGNGMSGDRDNPNQPSGSSSSATVILQRSILAFSFSIISMGV